VKELNDLVSQLTHDFDSEKQTAKCVCHDIFEEEF
jgi:hypothetical protein